MKSRRWHRCLSQMETKMVPIDDGEVSDYAEDAMAWAVENGITKLLPRDSTDQAQLAAIIYRVETR